jgi:gamma-glutamylcyclotransferase (GGCT)/AIG2-like uncharacterized protein YtfP
MHLFAYGTLMCPDIMTEVSGLQLPTTFATLRGYRRLRVKGEDYPALVPDATGLVSGVIYRGITETAWTLLDRFEGEMYARVGAQVELADGTVSAAQTYVVNGSFGACLEEVEWDFAEFLRSGKERFRTSYRGYLELS